MQYINKSSWLFALLCFLSSCLTHAQNEISNSKNDLQKISQAIQKDVDSLKIHAQNDTSYLHALVDSLSKKVEYLQDLTHGNTIEDSLRLVIHQLTSRLNNVSNNNLRLKNQLFELKEQFSEMFRLPGTKAIQVETRQSIYDCYQVNLKEINLELFWKDEQGNPLGSLNALQEHLYRKRQQLVFAMNAGMYQRDQSPQGLFIQNGEELMAIDRKKEEYGNFYMQPNGVFVIDTAKLAGLIVTDQFDSIAHNKAVFATQSGPMALINGQINDKFNKNSTSKFIRNGVGIIDEHNIVFIISNKPVNFYDFASVFKEKFNCSDALYLDGAISRMFLPQLHRMQKGGKFGPILGIYK